MHTCGKKRKKGTKPILKKYTGFGIEQVQSDFTHVAGNSQEVKKKCSINIAKMGKILYIFFYKLKIITILYLKYNKLCT